MEMLYAALFVCYTSYACNRKSVALSLPALKAEGLPTSYAGMIVSSQNVAFMASKFAAGLLSDRLDPALLFAAGLLLGGVSAAAFSCSTNVAILCALWFLNGAAQGCGWPAIAKILRRRAPASQFGTLWSLMSSSINVAGSLSPLAAAFLVARFGWRWNVFLAGLLSMFLGVLFLFFLPFLSKSADSVTADKKATNHPRRAGGDMRSLLSEPFVWLLSTVFAVVFSARTTAVDWGQLYLVEERGQSPLTASAFTSSFESGGFLGRIAAGYLTDYAVQRYRKQGSCSLRLSVGVLYLLGSVAATHCLRTCISEASSPVLVMVVGASQGFSVYGVIAIVGIVAAESVPPRLSGSSNAVVSLFGNVGAVLSGLPFSYLAQRRGWASVFFLVECLLAGALLLMICCRNATPPKRSEKRDS